jgi:hypothetical protein
VISDRRTRIINDFEISSKRALSRYIGCAEGDKTIGCSVRRYSVRWALSRRADRHNRRKELLEFWNQ